MIAKEYSWLVHKLCGRADRQATGRDTIVMPPITGAIRRPGTLADAQLARARVDVESESTSLRLTAALMNAQRSSSRQVICQRHDERNMHCDLYMPCTIPAESIFPRPREHAGRRRRNYHTATASLRWRFFPTGECMVLFFRVFGRFTFTKLHSCNDFLQHDRLTEQQGELVHLRQQVRFSWKEHSSSFDWFTCGVF